MRGYLSDIPTMCPYIWRGVTDENDWISPPNGDLRTVELLFTSVRGT